VTDWVLSLEGTDSGRGVAFALVILAAVLHAVFGALQKGKLDPWLTRGAVDVSYSLMSIPIVLFVVPLPKPHLWPLLFGAMVIHFIYKLCQAMAYERGDYTVVYPVVRGIGPLITVLAVGYVFGENYNWLQWSGVMCLSIAIFALAGVNLAQNKLDRRTMGIGLLFAVLAGFGVAAYTTWDAYGVRAAVDPFTFIFWLFVLEGILFPPISYLRYRHVADKPAFSALASRGIIGGLVAIVSFGAIMVAARLDKVGEVAVLRETSVVFAALIGWLFLREKVGHLRLCLMVSIAAGAILVEFGG
jgi:drug/metabolite transporter (DMT)-like permease